MTPEQFCYWLQGFFELSMVGDDTAITLSPAQIRMVNDHLALVFQKQTHDRPNLADILKPIPRPSAGDRRIC